jgi:hypothetical protein
VLNAEPIAVAGIGHDVAETSERTGGNDAPALQPHSEGMRI